MGDSVFETIGPVGDLAVEAVVSTEDSVYETIGPVRGSVVEIVVSMED
jgi:hypothetical protein